MKESQSDKIKSKLKKMTERQTQPENENNRLKAVSSGTKIIRIRKGSPDKHIM